MLQKGDRHNMKVENIREINTTALAYMGDAVYELAVREEMMKQGYYDVNRLHHIATLYVRASAQAKVIKTIFDELDEKEQALVKRARNRKSATKAKNADPVTYKWATAFEALAGHLYLTENEERLSWLMNRAIGIIKEDHTNGRKKGKEETESQK